MPNPILDGLKQAQPADPMKALQKATSIGPPHMGERPLPTPAEEANPISRFIDMTGLGGQDALGNIGPGEAIAVGGPANIPILKAKGKELVDKVLKEGLESRSIGMRPRQLPGFVDRLRGRMGEYVPNTPIPDGLAKALQYAQQRYPRLFGHVADVANVDAFSQLKNYPAVVRGESGRAIGDPSGRMSRLGFNPKEATADTVGHELLHAADRLVYGEPEIADRYDFSQKLPGGYAANSFEIRARNAGESFNTKFLQTHPEHIPQPPEPEDPTVLRGLKNLMGARDELMGNKKPLK